MLTDVAVVVPINSAPAVDLSMLGVFTAVVVVIVPVLMAEVLGIVNVAAPPLPLSTVTVFAPLLYTLVSGDTIGMSNSFV
jgi:hypothetical protein